MKIKIIYNGIFLGIMAAFVASCTVGKKYEQTKLNIPEQYRTSKTEVKGDSILLPWKSFFKDPQLASYIEKALVNNNDVATAIKNMEQLDLAYKKAKSNILPTVDFSVGAGRTWSSSNSLNGSLNEQFSRNKYIDDYTATLKASWEVDIWGKTKMQKESALADYFAQKENLSALKTRIIVQVAQAYYNLISLDEQVKIAEKNIELSENTLKMMRLQYTSGQINSLAIQQSEAQKKTAELLIPQAKQNIAVQENALSILCGEFPTAFERANSLQKMMSTEILSEGIPAMLISRRPDVKAAEYSVVSLNAKTGLAKAAMYPTFSLSPQIGVNSSKFSSWFDVPGSVTKAIAANLANPILQKRQLKTAYETAILEQEKAVINYKKVLMQAVSEVSDAMAKSHGTTERLELLEKKGGYLEKGINDALKLYTYGKSSYLEVITAQNNKLQNDLSTISVILEKLSAEVDLYRVLGGGIN
ncbi:TolC family protein [Cloacibacterium sp.]|uniref:TolC family protein n=1 Tax=Cloacibacterium sp. TaxID=1913682 RepID=UPI0039E2FDF0